MLFVTCEIGKNICAHVVTLMSFVSSMNGQRRAKPANLIESQGEEGLIIEVLIAGF